MKDEATMQVVYERNEMEGYGSERVGLRIEDRVLWLSFMDTFTKPEGLCEYKKWESIAKEMVKRWEATHE